MYGLSVKAVADSMHAQVRGMRPTQFHELSKGEEIETITRSNRELLQRGAQAAREAIAAMGEIDIDAYDATGALPDRSLALRIVDEAI